MYKKVFAVLLAGAMAVSVAACGGSSSSGSTDTKSSSDSTGASASGSAADLAKESKILSDGTLTVGTNAQFPPFEYVGEGGKPAGFDIALINAMAEKMDVKVEVKDMEFNSLVSSIGNKIDVAIAGMTITEERKNAVSFSDSYYNAVQYVLLPKDSKIATASDLEGKKIGTQLGTTGDFYAQDIKGAEDKSYDTAVNAVKDLANGRLDAVIIDENPAKVFQSKYPDQINAFEGSQFGFEPEKYAIACPKDDDATLAALNQALKEVKEDGTYDKLVKEEITDYVGSSSGDTSAAADTAAAQ